MKNHEFGGENVHDGVASVPEYMQAKTVETLEYDQVAYVNKDSFKWTPGRDSKLVVDSVDPAMLRRPNNDKEYAAVVRVITWVNGEPVDGYLADFRHVSYINDRSQEECEEHAEEWKTIDVLAAVYVDPEGNLDLRGPREVFPQLIELTQVQNAPAEGLGHSQMAITPQPIHQPQTND